MPITSIEHGVQKVGGVDSRFFRIKFNESDPHKAIVRVTVPQENSPHQAFYAGDMIFNLIQRQDDGLHSLAYDVTKTAPKNIKRVDLPQADIPGYKIGKYVAENGFTQIGDPAVEAFPLIYGKPSKSENYWQAVGEFLTQFPTWISKAS